MNRIGQADNDACPNCGHRPHDTGHLFACPNKPTDLTVVSLWSDPVGSAVFLGLDCTAEGEPPARTGVWANQSINQSRR